MNIFIYIYIYIYITFELFQKTQQRLNKTRIILQYLLKLNRFIPDDSTDYIYLRKVD